MALAAALLSGCSTQMMQQFEDGLAAMGGKGGTIARHDSYTETATLARELAKEQPAAAWETPFPEEAADIIEFIGKDRVLVGAIGAGAYLGTPAHGKISLYDARSGTKLWEVSRRDLPPGRYSVLATSPLIVLGGANQVSGVLMALDPASGAPRWERTVAPPLRVAAVDPDRLVSLAGPGGGTLESIEIATGKSLWRRTLDDALPDAKSVADLVVADKAVFVTGRKLVKLSAGTGEIVWTREVPALSSEHATMTPVAGGLLVWGSDTISFVDARTGDIRWTRSADAGKIKLVANLGGDVYRVVSRPRATASVLQEDWIESIDLSGGKPRWSRSVGAKVVSPLTTSVGLVLYSLDKAIVGLRTKDGKPQFRTRYAPKFARASPSWVPEYGMPDILLVRRGNIYVSREKAGVAAFELPTGRALWSQPIYEWIEGAYPYSTAAQANLLKTSLAIHGVQVPADPAVAGSVALANLSSTQSDMYIRASQTRMSWLAQERGHAMARGDSTKAIMASRQIEIETQMQSFNSQMAAAQQILGAGVALSSAIEHALRQQALQGMVIRCTMALQHATQLHQTAFRGRYYVRPFLDAGPLLGRGHGVTVVDLDSGKRADLIYAPYVVTLDQNGVNLPDAAIDPEGRRLVTVGIGLNPDRYRETVKWKHRLPQSSALAFDIARLKFDTRNTTLKTAAAPKQETLPEWAAEGDLGQVRRLLDSGVDINQRYSIGRSTALIFAAQAGHAAVVQLLIERGADVMLSNDYNYTAYDVAADDEIKAMLREASAKRPTRQPDRGS